MKKLTLLIAVITFATSFGQEAKDQQNGIMLYADKMPEPPYNVNSYLQQSLTYPKKAIEDRIYGRVAVQFVVMETGAIDYVKISKSVHPLLDSEAVRVVRLMPPWKPGRIKDSAVKVYYTLPISFRRSQENTKDSTEPQVYQYVEQMPEPEYDVNAYLKQYIHYPAKAPRYDNPLVVITVVFTETGAITNARVTKKQHPLLDSTALAVVQKMPRWKPARHKDSAVRVYYSIPIRFPSM